MERDHGMGRVVDYTFRNCARCVLVFFFCVVEKGEEKNRIGFIRHNRIVEWWKHTRSIGGGGSVWRQDSRD